MPKGMIKNVCHMSLILWDSKIKFNIDMLTQIKIASEIISCDSVTQDIALYQIPPQNLNGSSKAHPATVHIMTVFIRLIKYWCNRIPSLQPTVK